MIQAAAEWRTEHGRKYLVQLCKHFAHKIDVTYTEDHGECRFSCGMAVLDADDTGLKITAVAEGSEQLTETQSVIERHLVRFAFRENLEALQWQLQDRAA
ncbi:DUF2218 domain-containing protein [Rhizobium sp. XQZ8]|uniref:DUF2218 domain-containing protein n=1 Tax=Rhizobium populisoli TaxID=2859785 RepID=UPI001C675FDA|nr:DUF2218 domain-containing protein [Rhizobium populisoli]MBW6422574.1 DUF2218 domain-containing protein [Rhizobium populisoli]